MYVHVQNGFGMVIGLAKDYLKTKGKDWQKIA